MPDRTPLETWTAEMAKPQAKYPREDFVRFVRRNNFPKESSFLDMGCGGGGNSLFLCNEGFNVDAVDFVRSVEIIWPTFHFHEADLTAWDFPSEKYDCVLDNSTLCHIEDGDLVLEKARNSLKPGGKIFSVWPTCFNKPSQFGDKGYIKLLSPEEGRVYFKDFRDLRIGRLSYTDFSSMRSLTYWLIEGSK